MSVFSANIRHRSFWPQINLLCFVLGLLLAAAVHTTTQVTRAGVGTSNPGLSYGGSVQMTTEKIKEYEHEIKKKSEYATELENKLAKGTDAADVLNTKLQEAKFFAGLTEVTGPGLIVTLTDSKRQPLIPSDQLKLNSLIHDVDIANVVNELKAAGAEAIAVDGQRVVASTAIRCVGPAVQVNGVPTTPPYVIQAVGDPKALQSAMEMVGGVLDELRRFDQDMVHLEKKQTLHVPAFAGGTQMRFARPVKPADGESRSAKKEFR
jgi:uncharacterized protein YlxW (UPF0749 family)